MSEDIVYDFDRGVTATCSTGCYCRVNSTSRQHYCSYAAEVLQTETEGDCLARFGTRTFTDSWAAHCLQNHIDSWNSDSNLHFRARAYDAAKQLAGTFPDPASADGAALVRALSAPFPR